MQVKNKGEPVKSRTRLLLVEDHPVVRRGLNSVLARCANVEIVGEAEDGEEALAKIRELRPAVVLMDLDLPKKSGLEVAEALNQDALPVRVILLSAYSRAELLRRAAAAGVWRFLQKDSPINDVVQAIEDVAGPGATHLLPVIGEAEGGPDLASLTAREREVLTLVANGSRTHTIAAHFCISEDAVGVHRAALMRKLNARSTADLTRFAVNVGLVRP